MNRLYTTLVLILLLFVFSQFVIVSKSKDVKSPGYEVVRSYEGFEVRAYPNLTLATTELNTGSYKSAANTGFRRVAGYIFGQNEQQEKIAMTSPVIMAMSDSIEMSFIMPDGYNTSNLPKPNDNRVVIHEYQMEKLAVIRFGGWASDEVIVQKTTELQKLMDKEGLKYSDQVFYFGYNPPYQLMNRKNEIAIRLL